MPRSLLSSSALGTNHLNILGSVGEGKNFSLYPPRDPVNSSDKRQKNEKKINRSLLTCASSIHMGNSFMSNSEVLVCKLTSIHGGQEKLKKEAGDSNW